MTSHSLFILLATRQTFYCDMPSSAECSVLIPSSTLEDFPADLSDCDARSLLAGWTVAWHPVLVAQASQSPVWYRADAPPEPDLSPASHGGVSVPTFGGRTFIVPSVSLEKLPAGYEDRAKATGARWVTGGTRAEYVAALELSQFDSKSLEHEERTISVEDFYAVGYVALQIQILTRRLRYTSNLDQIHVESCLVEAATAYVNGHAAAAIENLHHVFDALAEERDHYFSSDPYLIDLTLVTSSTVDLAIESASRTDEGSVGDEDSDQAIAPPNYLLDDTAIADLKARDDPQAKAFKKRFANGVFGLACGGPPADWIIELASDSQVEDEMRRQRDQVESCIGVAPKVFARFAGGVSDWMVPSIKQLGYQGMISNDFVAGTGFGGESKVVLPCGGGDGEIEVLTTKPIDASSDASFLALAPRLGEAIDSGEIATGLLVHWPGSQCDSFDDVKRAASWGVALGKFWRVDDYFINGERPYHQGHLSMTDGQAAELLNESVAKGQPDAISSLATRFAEAARDETNQTVSALASLLSAEEPAGLKNASTINRQDAVASLAKSIGSIPREDGDAMLVINPHGMPIRTNTQLETPPKSDDHVFAVSLDSKHVVATVDTPGFGFSIVAPDPSGAKKHSEARKSVKPSLGKRLRDKFLGKPATICDRNFLHNEFMEVTIDRTTGGISAVYGGKSRGNRFSMRLVAVGITPKALDTTSREEPPRIPNGGFMVCDKLETVSTSAAEGVIRCTGRLMATEPEEGTANGELASFEITYRLQRGSRLIQTVIDLRPAANLFGSNASKPGAPWKNYIAVRSAVADESAIIRTISRDRLIRSSKRKMIAPLGVMMDEAERKTLIASHGLPFHRAEGERFVDTLIHVRGETRQASTIDFGFDVSDPVTTATAAISPPVTLPIEAPPSGASTGWFTHVGPRSVLIRDLQHHRLSSGADVITLRLMQTRSKPETAKLRFFRKTIAGYRIDGSVPQFLERFEKDQSAMESLRLEIKKDAVEVRMIQHGSAHLAMVLEGTGLHKVADGSDRG